MSRSQPPRSTPLLLPAWLVGTALMIMVLLVAAVQTRAVWVGQHHDAELAAQLLIEASPDASPFTNRRVLAELISETG